jgi:DTW domain-containing protein YfiP
MAHANGRSQRPICLTCLRPLSACLCRWITPIFPEIEVVVLQHPLEVSNAKGSARLLHLSLAGSRMVTGEAFVEDELQGLLHGAQGARQRQPVLLFPETLEEKSLGLAAPPALDHSLLADSQGIRLIVLDGTWRKSRKMLYLNPLLQSLPRLALSDMAPSRYRIRKAHKPDQLSTLEACCHGLMQLESAPHKYAALLDAFNGFVEQ